MRQHHVRQLISQPLGWSSTETAKTQTVQSHVFATVAQAANSVDFAATLPFVSLISTKIISK
ncbi:MAG: hypothetical protein ACLUSV_08640 [Streptococcus sp.]